MDFKKPLGINALEKTLEKIGAKTLLEAVARAKSSPIPSECPINDDLWAEQRAKAYLKKALPKQSSIESTPTPPRRLPYKDDDEPSIPF